jgi:RNA polymerase sigma-70 factor (ECF subfamily)
MMRSAQRGDRNAYEALLRELTPLVHGFVRRRVRRPEWVDDIVQETLLCIHRDRHTYDPCRQFGPWMYAIARHRLLDFAAKQRRRERNEVADGRDGQRVGQSGGAATPEHVAGFLRQALALLSQRQREVIHMLKFEGRSVAEISKTTGLSESLVKVTAHRGYRSLRSLLAGATREQ